MWEGEAFYSAFLDAALDNIAVLVRGDLTGDEDETVGLDCLGLIPPLIDRIGLRVDEHT